MFNFPKTPSDGDEFAIPKKYDEMPSEIVEELLKGEAVLVDPKLEAEAKKRRAKIMEKVKEKEKKILEINPNVFDVLEKILSTTELTSEERGVLEKSLSQYRNSQTENQSGEEKQRFGLEFVNKKERDIFQDQ